jgi:hypothetical protein
MAAVILLRSHYCFRARPSQGWIFALNSLTMTDEAAQADSYSYRYNCV